MPTDSAQPSSESLATLLAHDDEQMLDAVVPPIVQTSLFTFQSFESMEDRFRGRTQRPSYSRNDNPTVQVFERKMAALEGAEAARAFASGIGAISNAVLSLVRSGDRVVSVRDTYPRAYTLMKSFLPSFGVTTDFVDGRDIDAVAKAVRGARVLYLESPASWTFEALDIATLARLAREEGAVSVIDNSWSTPVFQKPLRHGVDICLHSASKFISGHSDTIGGVVCASRDLIRQMDERVVGVIGARMSPLDAWLMLRGLRTLTVRMEKHQTSGMEIARRLAGHGKVARVRHPALAGPLPGSLTGTSSVFSIELAPDLDVARFCNALRVFRLGVSWGGFESLACPAAVNLGGKVPNSYDDFGISPRMVRLHVGLEAVSDLWADLDQALKVAG